MHPRRYHCYFLIGAIVAASCSSDDRLAPPTTRAAERAAESTAEGPVAPTTATPSADAPVVAARIEHTAFAVEICADDFRVLELPHEVQVLRPETRFDANGAGVAIGDLDGDGRLDVVLGNLDGPIRVFWNEGDWLFTESVLLSGRARSVQPVDVDGDGDLDVAIGPGLAPPLVLFNRQIQGEPRGFDVGSLPGVSAPAYSMVWFDPDRDGDLDLVTAAYDMEFGQVVGGEYVSDGEHGAWYVEQTTDGWRPTQLADLAHALAITHVDLDADGDHDLIVGNDYGLPDGVWTWDGGWTSASDLLGVTAANTMSFDLGDVDGDGDDDLYATDMVPFGDDNPEFWEAMAEMDHDPPGPQLVENVLIDLGDRSNIAPRAGVEASGWSWSGRFADLDHDADLDLYVANGMAASPLYVLEEELVEQNVAFRNDGNGSFVPAPEWGLDATAGSRGIATGDLDGDGDLDLVVSTVDAPALAFENRLCGGPSIVVEPRQTDRNRFAIGAEVIVRTDGPTLRRTIRSGVGYLAAEPPAAHFGLGDHRVEAIEVVWPDGARSVIDGPADGRISVERTDTG